MFGIFNTFGNTSVVCLLSLVKQDTAALYIFYTFAMAGK